MGVLRKEYLSRSSILAAAIEAELASASPHAGAS
jgi:hypothetical protein